MKKRNIIFIILTIVIVSIGILFFSTGRARTDAVLNDFVISDNGEKITLKVGVSGSAGYLRKMKNKLRGDNHYLTFYSTFGINQKTLSEDTFELKINLNATEIYFYTGNGGYQKVLQKDTNTGEWLRTASFTNNTTK